MQTEIDWGDTGPITHKNGPDTEQMAADFMANKVTGLRLQALRSIASVTAGLSSSQVVRSVGAYEYSVKPRITELQRLGLVVDTGLRQKNERNRQEVVWAATPKGQELLGGIDAKNS